MPEWAIDVLIGEMPAIQAERQLERIEAAIIAHTTPPFIRRRLHMIERTISLPDLDPPPSSPEAMINKLRAAGVKVKSKPKADSHG